jgi:hypothetical protein
MKASGSWRATACALWLLASGCTALREIPRHEFGAKSERKGVRIQTTEGLVYEFDYAQVSGDTLVGYRQRDLGGGEADEAILAMDLDEVTTLSARSIDWRRTALVGGGVVAAVVAAGLTRDKNSSSSSTPGPPKPELVFRPDARK